MIQPETSMSEDNSKYIPDDWGMGANKKGMNTTLYQYHHAWVVMKLYTCTRVHMNTHITRINDVKVIYEVLSVVGRL